jgi:hypothetical protein
MKWVRPLYGRQVQYVPKVNQLPILDTKGTRLVQSKVGTFLYYGRAVEPTILVALNEIGIDQSKPTQNTVDQLDMLMDYLATYPNGALRFYAGTIQLKAESDASH